MAAISKTDFAEIAEAQRWDAEAFTPLLRSLDRKLANAPKLTDLATVTHPAEIPRVYSEADDAVPFLRAQNIRPFLPDTENLAFIPAVVAKGLPTNRLETGDILVTRSGVFSGVATIYLGKSGGSYASGEGIIVRCRGKIDSAYLVAFLNTQAGSALCRRAIYGSGQPHIGPKYLERVQVPRLGSIEEQAAELVREADRVLETARNAYPQAECELLDRLKWTKLLEQPRELSYSADFSTLTASGRSDAEFFHPHATRIQRLLSGTNKRIADVANVREEHFTPSTGHRFHYIEISDVSPNTTVTASELNGEDAPSRAQFVVHAGDVITSTVRPLRRLSGLIANEQDGWVCSSGFVVLALRNVPPEYLVAYLRLRPVCELMDAWTMASMYPAITIRDLLAIPFFLPGQDLVDKICSAVKNARMARAQAESKLVEAKRLVEEALTN